MRQQHLLTMGGGRLGMQRGRLGRHTMPGLEIERAIEGGFGASRISADHRWLPAWSPDAHRGGLQVERGFVGRKDRCLWSVVAHVNQVVSTCSAQVMTCASWRDVKTCCVR